MRKMFTTLKSVVAATVIAAMALAASCSYDDSAINERVDRVEKDLAALTERVAALEKKLGEEVDALKKLIEKQTVVTKVEKADDGSTKVTLSDGSSFTVYPKAEAGAEAVDTTIAPNKDTDGTYYWAVFDGGKFQKYLEVDGKKVPVFAAEGCVCELKFQVSEETGKLLVSIDGGKTWVDSGLAAQQVASTGVFSDVVVNDDNTVTFTLADGDKFSVALAELIECEATRSGVYVLPGEVKAVRFTVNDAVEDINIMNQPHGWAATVEVAPAEEENGDENVDGPVAEPLAAGGTEYVLNIAGPAVGDEYAAKEGVVSVHFNTANGACKVLSINVNLAEITMSIDKDGNLTITNSVAMLQKGHQGSFIDFADFCFGFTSASDYQSYLDGEQPDLLYWQVTHRYFLGQILENGLKPYEENVYEKETITVSCDAIIKTLNYADAEYGKEYVFFASLGETMVQGQTFPDLANAAVATYTKTLVSAEVVEGSEKWNDATLKLSLLGYNSYIVGWVATETVESLMEGFGYKTLDEFYDKYLRHEATGLGFNPGIGAAMFPTMMGYTIKDTEIALSEMAEYSMTEWAPGVEPGTEYRLFVFPFNVDFNNFEMEMYTGEFDYSNVVDFGTFYTSPLVKAEFEVVTDDVNPSWEDNSVEATITLSENVKLAGYQIFYETAMNEDDRIADVLENAYLMERSSIYINEHVGDKDVVYVSIIAVNEYGQYSYEEVVLSNIDPIELTAASAVVEGQYVTLTFSNADGVEIKYTLEATDGVTSYLHEKKYGDKFKKDTDVNTGCITLVSWPDVAPYPYYMDVKVADDGKYDITLTAINNNTKAEHVAYYKGDIAGLGYEGEVELEDSAVATLVTDTNFGGFNPYDVKFTFAAGGQVVIRFNTSGNQYLHLGKWQADAWQDPHYISTVKLNGESAYASACNVAYENDAYTVTMTLYDYATSSNVDFTYTGAIEGLNAPEACDCLTPGGGDSGDDENCIDRFQIVPYGQMEVEVHFYLDEGTINKIVLDFRIAEADAKLKTQTYSWNNNGFEQDYSYINGTSGEFINDASIDVVVNSDGTYSFKGSVKSNAKTYPINISGTPALQ